MPRYSHFNKKHKAPSNTYQTLQEKPEDFLNQNNNNNSTVSDVESDANRIARLAGYAALDQYRRLKHENSQNNSNVKTFIIDGYLNDPKVLQPFNQQKSILNRVLTMMLKVSTAGDATYEQIPFPANERHRQLPSHANDMRDVFEQLPSDSLQGLSSDDCILGRKKIYTSTVKVHQYYQYDQNDNQIIDYPESIDVITSNRAGAQLGRKDTELRHFIITPPSYQQREYDLDSFFAQRYFERNQFPSHQEALDNFNNGDYCFVKRDHTDEMLMWDEDRFAFGSDSTKAFIFNKRAYFNSLVEDIRNELLGFQYEVDQQNLKNKPKTCLSQLYSAFVNTDKPGWFKLTASGTGVFADVLLSGSSVSAEVFDVFFQAVIKVCQELPKPSSGKLVVEIPLLDEDAQNKFSQFFTDGVLAKLEKNGITIIAGKNRDVFDFTHVDRSKYIVGASNPGDVNALAGNKLDGKTDESKMGITSTMPQDMVWIFNFMKMLSPHNQFFVSVKDGKPVYESVAERYPELAEQFDQMNTPEKCRKLFSTFVDGVKEYMVDELVSEKGWPKTAAEQKVDEWYAQTEFENVKQNEIFEGKSFCEKTFFFTRVANGQLLEFKKQPIPEQPKEEFYNMDELDPYYTTPTL